MAPGRKTTIGEWIGVALLFVGSVGVVAFTRRAYDHGELFDPFALALIPVTLIGAAVTVICNRRAIRKPT
jgi:hypothetical protein